MRKFDFCWTPLPLLLKGIGVGGPRSNFEFSLVLTYVIALIFQFSEWAHLSLNSRRLLRYGMTKSATTRTFSGKRQKMYGKIAEKLSFLFFRNWQKHFNLAPVHFQNPIFGQVVLFDGLHKRNLGFFTIIDFWLDFWAWNMQKWQNFGKIGQCSSFQPQNWPKNSKSS